MLDTSTFQFVSHSSSLSLQTLTNQIHFLRTTKITTDQSTLTPMIRSMQWRQCGDDEILFQINHHLHITKYFYPPPPSLEWALMLLTLKTFKYQIKMYLFT